ncbi:MAG TPA: hypothetical protein VGR57_03585 [Ktedonobacterales bacterium]|nr:hypothetical protein [Ktedonobacterales bacterium]
MPDDQHPNGDDEPPLPLDLAAALAARGLLADGEVALRRALEAHLPGYSLYRLLPAAARRWKTRYRLMAGDAYYDGQTAAEAYARALLAAVVEQGR